MRNESRHSTSASNSGPARSTLRYAFRSLHYIARALLMDSPVDKPPFKHTGKQMSAFLHMMAATRELEEAVSDHSKMSNP